MLQTRDQLSLPKLKTTRLPKALRKALSTAESFEQQELHKIAKQIWQAIKEGKKYSYSKNAATLHKYRIALRKARCYLNIVAPRLPKTPADRLEKLLKELVKPTGRLRDLDTLMMQQSVYEEALGSATAENSNTWVETLKSAQDRAKDKIAAFFASKMFEKKTTKAYEIIFALDKKLARRRSNLPLFAAKGYTKQQLEDHRVDFENEARYLNFAKVREKKLHQLRLTIKEIRYLAERVEEMEKEDEKIVSLVSEYKKLQKDYGMFCDACVHSKIILNSVKSLDEETQKRISFALNKIKLDRRIALARDTIEELALPTHH